MEAGEDGAFLWLAGTDGRSVGFTAFEGISQRIEFQAALGLGSAMALDAFRFKQRLHIFEEVDAAFVRGLVRHGGDFGGDEVVDLVAFREAFGQRGHLHFPGLGEPLFCGIAALGPVAVKFGAHRRTRFGIHLVVMRGSLGFIGRPACVVVGDFTFARREEFP